MRSKLLSLASCDGLVTEPIVESMPLSEIRDNVERDLGNLCMQCKQMQEVPVAAEGDTVCLRLSSAAPKFNRSGLYLCVGAKLFDAELEAALPGKQVGEEFAVCVGDEQVSVQIEKCLHTVIPEPSDALIAQQGIPGVATLSQYRSYTAQKYRAMYRDAYLEYLADMYMEQWFDASQWEIDSAELDVFSQEFKRRYDEECEMHNSQMLESYPGELEDMLRNDALRYLQCVLVKCQKEGTPTRSAEDWLVSDREKREIMQSVSAPLQAVISPQFTLNWEEEE